MTQIFHHTTQSTKRYFRRPALSGSQLLDPHYLAMRVRALRAGEEPVFLAGYSRGAAIVIQAARDLNLDDIPVQAMFLFDAVDRSRTLGGTEVIAANVLHVYHAVRDGAARSRMSFGTTGRRAFHGHAYKEKAFRTTYGGMGGCPWDASGMPFREQLEYALAPQARRRWLREHTRVQEGAAEAFGALAARLFDWTSEGYLGEQFGSPQGETTLTISDEELGMRSVQRWMWKWLRHHGVVNN